MKSGDRVRRPVFQTLDVRLAEPDEPQVWRLHGLQAEQRRDVVASCQYVGELGRCEAEACCKRQVEQQFKRRRNAVRLMRIASACSFRFMADSACVRFHVYSDCKEQLVSSWNPIVGRLTWFHRSHRAPTPRLGSKGPNFVAATR